MLGKYHRGDTVIELLMAFTIFSLAAIATITVLNQGIAIAERSMEVSLVRQQIDSQAEVIRYIEATKDPAWTILTGPSVLTTTPSPLSQSACPNISALSGGKSFFITQNTTGAFRVNTITVASSNYIDAATYARINYSQTAPKALGLWVEVAKAENVGHAANLEAYDFYIHACWTGMGTSVPMTQGTIVRVYAR